MFDLATIDLPVLGAGVLFIGAGLAGLLLVLLRERATVRDGLDIDASVRALKVAAGLVNPEMQPFVDSSLTADVPEVRQGESFVHADRHRRAEVPEVQDLLARLFALRMLVSDVTEEIHSLRDMYNLDDDVVEDIEEADDDLAEMMEGDFPHQPRRKPSAVEAA